MDFRCGAIEADLHLDVFFAEGFCPVSVDECSVGQNPEFDTGCAIIDDLFYGGMQHRFSAQKDDHFGACFGCFVDHAIYFGCRQIFFFAVGTGNIALWAGQVAPGSQVYIYERKFWDSLWLLSEKKIITGQMVENVVYVS